MLAAKVTVVARRLRSSYAIKDNDDDVVLVCGSLRQRPAPISSAKLNY